MRFAFYQNVKEWIPSTFSEELNQKYWRTDWNANYTPQWPVFFHIILRCPKTSTLLVDLSRKQVGKREDSRFYTF